MVKNYKPDYTASLDPAYIPAPEPVRGIFKRLNKYKKEIVKRVGRKAAITDEMFLSYYDGYQLTTYSKAVISLSERPIAVQDSFLKTFIKAEKLNLTLKPDPCPRVIQPRTPRYNVELGKYLKHIEHPIYKAIDQLWGGKTIFKGMSVEAMGTEIHKKMRSFPRPCAIGFDASRFDQHVSVEALEFEHSIYKSIHGYPELLGLLLKWQIHNTGTAHTNDGFFKYSVEGKRMSGDMNTSLGNCILASLIVKDLVDTLGIKAHLVNNGDDNVLICSEDDEEVVASALYDHWMRYGFEVVAEPPVYITEQVEFCQMKPVFDGTQYILMRNPTVSMSKDAHSITPFYTPKSARKWCRAVGEAGLSLTGGMPIKQAYYQCMIRNGVDKGRIHLSKEFRYGLSYVLHNGNSDRKVRPIAAATRYSFYLAFGYTPDEQEALERYYDSLTLEWTESRLGIPARTPECLLLRLLPQIPLQPRSQRKPVVRRTASKPDQPDSQWLPALVAPL